MYYTDFTSTLWILCVQGKLTEHFFPATPLFIFHTAALIHAWELSSATANLYCQPADSITGTFPGLNALLKYTLTCVEEVEEEENVLPFTFDTGFSSL